MRSCLRYPLGERRFELTWQILVFNGFDLFDLFGVFGVFKGGRVLAQGICFASKGQQKGTRKLHLANGRRQTSNGKRRRNHHIPPEYAFSF
jgi:hypothetical protein